MFFLRLCRPTLLDQCEGLPTEAGVAPSVPDPVMTRIEADIIIKRSGADFRIGGREAYYAPAEDFVMVPPQVAFPDPINWYRTALHELGHNAAIRIMPHLLDVARSAL